VNARACFFLICAGIALLDEDAAVDDDAAVDPTGTGTSSLVLDLTLGKFIGVVTSKTNEFKSTHRDC